MYALIKKGDEKWQTDIEKCVLKFSNFLYIRNRGIVS